VKARIKLSSPSGKVEMVPSWSQAQGNGWIDRGIKLSRSVYVYISIYDGHVMAMPSYPVPSGPFPLSNVLVASKEKSATEKNVCKIKKLV
jgi:hypothetical protein